MTQRTAGSILAGVVAGLVFLVFLLALGTAWPWALLAAAAAYGAMVLVLPKGRKEVVEYPAGLNAQRVEEIIAEARATIDRIRLASRGLSDAGVRRKTQHVCQSATKIVNQLERDPKDIQRARQFLAYYLDATERIVQRYAELSRHADTGESVRETLDRVGPTLEVIDAAFRRQLESLLHDDVLDLDTEISLLERTVRMEGLLEAPPVPPDLEPMPSLDREEGEKAPLRRSPPDDDHGRRAAP